MCHFSLVRCSSSAVITAFVAYALASHVLITPHAMAQADLATEDDAEGSALGEARRALERGDAELAIDILEEAQQSSDDPALLYELYLAYEQARDRARAMEHLEAYLDSGASIEAERRTSLEAHLQEMRNASRSTSGNDPTLGVIGWSLLGAGIAGVITFAASASATLVLTDRLSAPCRADASMCGPGERGPIDTAWIVAGVGLGAGLVLGAVGGVLLFLAAQDEGGATQSLPPDLDPTLQRPFSWLPWADPSSGSGGATLRIQF